MVNISSKRREHESASSSEDDSEQEYQVEAILDKRVRGKTTQYLLKWKGYSNADNTWENESRLNCPDLVENFEKQLQTKNNKRKSRSKSRKQSTSKNTNMQDIDEDYENDENQSISTESTIDLTNNDDHGRIGMRHSPRKKACLSKSTNGQSSPTRRHSNRKIATQTKSRITTMAKDESSDNNDDDDDDIIEKESTSSITHSSTPKIKITTNENDIQSNSAIYFSDESPTKEIHINEPTTINLRLRITPSSTSSVSLTVNDTNNNTNNDKSSTESNPNDEDTSDVIDETDQVEKIEAVRNNKHGISFRIKLLNENQSQWISSKIANKKYSQAIIAFWENYVQFT